MELNPKNRVDGESIRRLIREILPLRQATADLWDGALSWWKDTFLCANLGRFCFSYSFKRSRMFHNGLLLLFNSPSQVVNQDNFLGIPENSGHHLPSR